MKCLIGMQPVTAGTIIHKGKEVHFKSVQDSIHAGITMIQQELSPVLKVLSRTTSGLAASP